MKTLMDRNPSLRRLALDRVTFENAVIFKEEEIPNVDSFRVTVMYYANKHRIKLSVHHDRRAGEIEVSRMRQGPVEPIGRIGKATRRYAV